MMTFIHFFKRLIHITIFAKSQTHCCATSALSKMLVDFP